MLTKIEIKSFRGLSDLEISPLKRINLIIGKNNTGKTSVLEAIALLLKAQNGSANDLPKLFRSSAGDIHENFWKWLYPNKDNSLSIALKAQFKDGEDFALFAGDEAKARLFLNNYYQTSSGAGLNFYFLSSSIRENVSIFSTHPGDPTQDAIDYNRVVIKRKKKQVEALLRKIEPRLESIENLQTGQSPLLYADIGLRELIPVTQLGQGFNRLLDIYAELMAEESKVLLIDEIENGLHHSVLATVWEGLFHASAELDVQIFATTHSWECVLAADAAARKSSSYELNLIRMDRVEGAIKATLIDEGTIHTAKELGWEMR